MAGGSGMLFGATLVGNGLIAAAKFAVAAASGSAAMLAEAVHSLVDTGQQALLIHGRRRASRPADSSHPFGYGREIYFWAFVVAVVLIGIGAGVSLAEGLHQLRQPQPIRHPSWTYALLGIALVFEAASWRLAWGQLGRVRGDRPVLTALRRSGDPSLLARLVGDSAAILGLLVALAGILASDRLGLLRADGAAAIGVAAILAALALALARETKRLLIAEATDEDLISDIFGIAGQADFVDGVNEVRTTQFGPAEVVVNLSVDAKDSWLVGDLEQGIAGLEAEIRRRHAAVSRVFVEIQRAVGSGPPAGAAQS